MFKFYLFIFALSLSLFASVGHAETSTISKYTAPDFINSEFERIALIEGRAEKFKALRSLMDTISRLIDANYVSISHDTSLHIDPEDEAYFLDVEMVFGVLPHSLEGMPKCSTAFAFFRALYSPQPISLETLPESVKKFWRVYKGLCTAQDRGIFVPVEQ
ncbi:MAG: hypothetical protein GJ680_21120 [Alteromonadaceae bacterium]|nr:hypothetical protein [Alteromonadaceae bacterium]